MKHNILLIAMLILITPISAQNIFTDNDECANAGDIGGFGLSCSVIDIYESTTIDATFNTETDLFSCDSSALKSSVFFKFITGVTDVEFQLHFGENINVTVLSISEDGNCNPANLELTGNCFKNINFYCQDTNSPINSKVLFTNLTIGTNYMLAIWTDETEQTDFAFCLARAPQYECGDGDCYALAENSENCPEDCSSPEIEPPLNDECTDSDDFSIYVRPDLNCLSNSTTEWATFNNGTDIFSCDNDTLKSTIFYQFNTQSENIEFNLIEGENINVTVLQYEENSCGVDSLELTENCFTNLSANLDDPDAPEALFTGLTPLSEELTTYLLAIWTSEVNETDFQFYLSPAPEIACGDSICYTLTENPDNCPDDCLNTSVKELSTAFQISPNLVIDNIFIKNKSVDLKNVTINIISMDGKIWHQQNFERLFADYKLNLSYLPVGMHYLQIVGNEKHTYSHKFLKM